MSKKEDKREVGVATHLNVDLDNTFSTILHFVERDVELSRDKVLFVPSETTELPPEITPIDIGERKGNKGKSCLGTYYSHLLPDYVVEEIDEHDTKGRAKPRVPLAELFAASKRSGMSDFELLKFWEVIVRGLMEIKKEKEVAKQLLHKQPTVVLLGEQWVVSEVHIPGLSQIAEEEGYAGSIYWSSTGCGIVRFPSRTDISLSFVPDMRGWFRLPFMVAYGTRKSPKVMPPPQFSNMREFLSQLERWSEEYERRKK